MPWVRGQVYVQHVKYQHARFQHQGNECFARARYEFEKDHGGCHEDGSNEDGVQYRYGLCSQHQVFGIKARYLLWENGKDQQNGEQRQKRHLQNAQQQAGNLSLFLGPNQSTGQRIGRDTVGKHRNRTKHIDAAHDSRDGHRFFAQMFNHGEKEEPCAKRDQTLEHRGQRDFQNGTKQGWFKAGKPEKVVLPVGQLHKRVDEEYHGGRNFRQHR